MTNFVGVLRPEQALVWKIMSECRMGGCPLQVEEKPWRGVTIVNHGAFSLELDEYGSSEMDLWQVFKEWHNLIHYEMERPFRM